MKRTTLGWAAALLLLAGGCAGLTDLSISARNRSAAYKAWRTARWDYWNQGVPHKMREHIGRGFQQGYYDVANGGDGQLPLFPPGDYWGPEYQSPQGNELIAAWFRGYTDGALAADRSGIGGYHTLPTSWAPPYANDPDSPDGGFTPAPNQNNPAAPGMPGGTTPGPHGVPPQYPPAPRLEEVPPQVPLEKPVSVPILPGHAPLNLGTPLQGGAVIPHPGPVPPALMVPQLESDGGPASYGPPSYGSPKQASPDDAAPAERQAAPSPVLPAPTIAAPSGMMSVPTITGPVNIGPPTPEFIGTAPTAEPVKK